MANLLDNSNIIEHEIYDEMKNSYIDYAMSVIVGRALPDVRDGLKPVHRRILYGMHSLGITPDKPHKKSARIVGEVMGKYHPHGDSSIYDAMVKMAQDFSTRYLLVDGHGNFGSIDGDPPAAYRYTEARMSKIANEMLRDIEKETVDWIPNFDESRKEPIVLPSRFPNLLVNGSSGIAVGMATNIPPHNLKEVIDACVCILDNPEATLSDLMQFVKGPDFPTRAMIMGRSGIKEAYATGRGRVIMRARTEFETFANDRTRIIVTELPYQVNKRMLIKNIADQVKDKRLDGISDLRDESDRNGMRIVIEVKRDSNPQVVLNRLFTQTDLQCSFSINMLALVDNQTQPKILSLRHILDEYLKFQEQIIVRRTEYDLKKAKERAHILEGLIIAQDNIDEVIKIIRESYDDAKERLMARFSLSEVQAQAILDMRLKALQGLDREKLQADYDELLKKIAYYEEILGSEELVKKILKEELCEIRDKYGDDRRTEIQDVENEVDIEDLIEERDCIFTMTEMGYIKRLAADTYRTQHRGGRGVTGVTTKEEDVVDTIFVSSTHDNILFFTSLGRVHRLKGYQIPEGSRTSKGLPIVNLLEIQGEEQITAGIPVKDMKEDKYIFFTTRNGTVKRIALSALNTARRAGVKAISLDEGDRLVSVCLTTGDDRILIATKNGSAVLFSEKEVRTMGREAGGVRGIRLREGDEVIGAELVKPDTALLTVTGNGFGKRTDFDEYRELHRGTHGVTTHKLTDKTGELVSVKCVRDDDEILIINSDGIVIRTAVSGIRLCGRASQGVTLIRMAEGQKVISAAIAPKEDEDEGEAPEADAPAGETAAPVTEDEKES